MYLKTVEDWVYLCESLERYDKALDVRISLKSADTKTLYHLSINRCFDVLLPDFPVPGRMATAVYCSQVDSFSFP